MSTLQQSFGTRLKQLRKAAGRSQATLAEQAGISVDLVSQIERGKVAPSFRTIEAVAMALGLPVAELFRFGDQESRPTDQAGRPRKST